MRHETFDLQRGEEKIHSGKGQRSSQLTQYILSLSLKNSVSLTFLFFFSLSFTLTFSEHFFNGRQTIVNGIHSFRLFLFPLFISSIFHPPPLPSSTPFLLLLLLLPHSTLSDCLPYFSSHFPSKKKIEQFWVAKNRKQRVRGEKEREEKDFEREREAEKTNPKRIG